MKKLIMSVAMVISAVVFTGCGSKQESLVKEFYSAIQSKNNERCDKFAKEHFTKDLEEMLNGREGRELFGNVKKEFGKISDSKDSPQVKVLQEHEEGGVKYMALEAQCAGTTLYYVVADEKFQVITTKREFITK